MTMKRIERIYIIGLLVFGTLTNPIVSDEDYFTLHKREDGKFCRKDDHCESNVCRGKRCGGRPDGSNCKSDDECASNDCRGNRCGGRPKGLWCKEDEWCSSGNCHKKKCAEHWPTQLYKGAYDGRPWPANTKEAENAGWKKSDNEACASKLGEAWLYEGTRSFMHPVTLYFSPQIGDQDGIPGVLTGIQNEYYGKIMDGLVGRYFSEKKTDQDGKHYHSVAVGFRDSSKYNLCDNSKPLPPSHQEYVVIAPDMENLVIPSHEKSSELIENWVEGSCLNSMGFHWFKSAVKGSKDLTYERNSVVPVSPQYFPGGSIAGIFFYAPEKMQVWDDEICTPALFGNLPELGSCLAKCNFWDAGPGLNQKNSGALFMCANLCDDKCYFDDSYDGIITTSHFFFHPINTIHCDVNGSAKICRNGFDHKMFETYDKSGLM